MTNAQYGKRNISGGFLFLAAFMAYGFILIYLRDFAPGKEAWVDSYSFGKHFEARLAHVHGNLFAFLNILIGYLIIQLPLSTRAVKGISWLSLIGMLMPIGILAEFLLGAPPIFVLIGAICMVAAAGWMGIETARARFPTDDA